MLALHNKVAQRKMGVVMHKVAITGTGLFTPSQVITNDELVEAFNAYADLWNAENAAAIEAGTVQAKPHSSSEFIVAASGIENRYVLDKEGPLDPARMFPRLAQRSDDEPGYMAEIGVDAAQKAISAAGRTAADVDLVICAASNMERAYPAVGVEIQQLLGAGGFAFDMNVACSSATFGIQTAADMIRAGSIRSAIVVNPEICSAHLEWRDRDCHFIFGDVATATYLERDEGLDRPHLRCFRPVARHSSAITSATIAAFCVAPMTPWMTVAICNSCKTAARFSKKCYRWSASTSPTTCPTLASKHQTCAAYGFIKRTSR